MNIVSTIYHLPKEALLFVLRRRGLKTGKNFYCGEGVVIDSSFCWLVTIGDDVTLADRVYILAHDSSTKKPLNYTRIGRVSIGDRVFVGAMSVILPGVTIGNDVIIGAASVVGRDIPDGQVARGNPAVVTESVESFTERRRQELQAASCFEGAYVISRKLNAEMGSKLKSKYGYVV